MSAQAISTTVDPADLLEALRSHLAPVPFALAIYCPDGPEEGRSLERRCGALGDNSLCTANCRQVLEAAVQDALSRNQPAVFRCPAGLLNFAVPLPQEEHHACCVIGSGVRETALCLAQLEELSNAGSANGQALLERFEQLPCATPEQAEAAATTVHRLLPSLLDRNLYALALDRTTRQLSTLADVSAALDQAPTTERFFTLLGETLTILFNFAAVALVQTENDEHGTPLLQTTGLGQPPAGIAPGRLREFLRRHPAGQAVIAPAEIDALFPAVAPPLVAAVPLVTEGQPFGLLALFGNAPRPHDLLLVELLAGRAAAKLDRMRREAVTTREGTRAERLATMVGALALMESRDQLYQGMVDMAADLLAAESGSLMLLDDTGENLALRAVKGLSPPVARNLSLRVGTGIAGRVAKSGFPLLVTDIEKDSRTGIPNRPRFKTKSFLSVPVKLRERIIGVLNLADKENGGTFSESDLRLLTSFADHAALLGERIHAYERTSLLEELSVTDPLTDLYNRRFLEKRLDEELNRSARQRLSFSLMLIDLDTFKAYNDLCGHLAGDLALKKTATLLRSSAREMDIVTRYGGEEFCIVLPGTSKKESVLVAERIRRAVENEPFHREKELPSGRLTASVGVAAYPEDGQCARELLNAADVALYQAKGAGRNRIVLCSPALIEAREGTG